MRFSRLPTTLVAYLCSSKLVFGFYLPGISPTTYKLNDVVKLDVNHLTPSMSDRDAQVRSAFAFDYYHPAFHFCQPEDGPKYVSESLGSIIFGDRIQTSPFILHLGQNETCRAVCDAVTFQPSDAKFVNKRIWEDYNMNWLIDGLPAGQRYADAETLEEFYEPGFALGDPEGETPVLNNHYNIIVEYRQIRATQYRVVGILVDPQSDASAKRTGKGQDFSAKCSEDGGPVTLNENRPTKVTFTYSVFWRPSTTSFATRWDKFLHVYSPEIHWIWIIGSAVVFMCLIGIVSTILNRTLKRDITRYNRLDQLGLEDLNGNDMGDDVQEDSGWKLIHGDVFRPPKNILALSVLVGNGAQLFMMTGFTIAFAVIGFLSPSNRGSLATVMIMLYAFFGFIGGYVSSRVYKYFKGDSWKQLFVYTPCAVPMLVFGTFFLLNLFVWARRSSGAVPFTTMLVIVGIWFVISVPLSIAGSYVGFRQAIVEPPVRTNQIPRQIPPATGYLRRLPSMLLVGILPFGAIFTELFFIMRSLWSSMIYYMFGFLFLSFGLLVVTSAAVTIMLVYFVLCAEDYHWQWRAFVGSGASAAYFFLYCLLYWARMLSFSSLTGGLLYLGYSALLSFLWFVMAGESHFFLDKLLRSPPADVLRRHNWLSGVLGVCSPDLRLTEGGLSQASCTARWGSLPCSSGHVL